MRHIAAAGLAAGSVYRLIGAKEGLLASIMNAFHDRLSADYDGVLAAARPAAGGSHGTAGRPVRLRP